MAAKEPEYSVVSPVGQMGRVVDPAGGQLTNLSGKTICELWDYHFRGDEMFDLLRAELSSRYSSLSFIDWRNFGQIEYVSADDLRESLLEHRCDAVVAGVGA